MRQGISCQNSNPRLSNSDYIYYFLQKCKKGKPQKKDSPLLENDITGSEPTVRILDADTCNVLKTQATTSGHKKGRAK
jgi:hypothetical protein